MGAFLCFDRKESMMGSEKWFTVSQAAAAMQCHPNWVRRLADAGKITAERTPLGRLISRAEAERIGQQRRERLAAA
jgi:excisionase family DNA binding protein